MLTPQFWQTRNFTSTALLPFAALYGLGAALDRCVTTPQQAALPVLSIGNATAGGAGKTPSAMAIAALLRAMGQSPHFITRGYGSRRADRHVALPALPESDWHQVGDEAILLAQSAPTWVCPDRIAATAAAQKTGATLVIADDALQHHALRKDRSLLVVDGAYGFGNGRLLPAGPLREPVAAALKRCDAVILIGENRHGLSFDQPTFTARIAPEGDIGWAQGARLLAFAGLARPQKFYDTLQSLGAQLVATRDFADHHPFTAAELEQLCQQAERAGAIPIATAKDAVKFPVAYRDRIRTLPVALQWDTPAAVQNWLQTALALTI